VLPDTGLAETHSPLREELAERVGPGALGLGVDDAGRVMGVQGRDARSAATGDAAVGDSAVRVLEPLHLGVVDVDRDPRRHHDRLTIDEDVQMRVRVMDQELLALRLQSGCDRSSEGIVRGAPEDAGIGIG
jgi:hypothetical protein